MIFQVAREPATILDLSESEAADAAAMAKACQPAVVQRLVEGLLQGDSGIRHTLNKRVYMETQLMRSMREAHALRLDDVISRFRKLRDGGNLEELDDLAAPPVPTAALPPATPARPAPPPKPTATPPPGEDRLLRGETPGDVVAMSAAMPATAAIIDEPTPEPAAPSDEAPLGVPGDFHGPPAQPMAMLGGEHRSTADDADDRHEVAASQAQRRAETPEDREDWAPMPEVPDDLDDRAYRQERSERPDREDRHADEAPPLPGSAASTTIWKRLDGNPVVKELCDLFAGRLIDVRGADSADSTTA
jgi:DNA polymerase-3 subunit gamma/tau